MRTGGTYCTHNVCPCLNEHGEQARAWNCTTTCGRPPSYFRKHNELQPCSNTASSTMQLLLLYSSPYYTVLSMQLLPLNSFFYILYSCFLIYLSFYHTACPASFYTTSSTIQLLLLYNFYYTASSLCCTASSIIQLVFSIQLLLPRSFLYKRVSSSVQLLL